MNRVGKNNGNNNQISDISVVWKQFATSIWGLFLSSSLSALFACSLSLSENSEIDSLLGCLIGDLQFK